LTSKNDPAGDIVTSPRRQQPVDSPRRCHYADDPARRPRCTLTATVQLSLPVLEHLVTATGLKLEVRVRKAPSPLALLTGPLGQKVRAQRAEIKRLAAKAGVTNLRVFGSVARGQETAHSDIDLLVDLGTDTGLFTFVALRGELERLLEAGVDLVPADSLKDGVRENALQEMVSL
jgi:uncharacterized protein